MPPTASQLTMEEYDRIYGHESGWEFRSGEAFAKSVTTFFHGILAALLADLLRLAGYINSVEADVRLTKDWTPRPDVCGVLTEVEGKCPRAVDVVFEVLSENEDIPTKCRKYHGSGAVSQIFVFDIEAKAIQTWDGTELIYIENLLLKNGVTITGRRIWRELESRGKQRPAPASMWID